MRIKKYSKVIGLFLGVLFFLCVTVRKIVLFYMEYFKELNELAEKYRRYNGVLQQWLRLKNAGRSVAEHLVKRNISNIAIYGMGDLGNRLYEELKFSAIKVLYGIDQNKDNVFSEIPVYSVEDELPPVDAIIVTPYLSYDQIILRVKEKYQGDIISLEDIIYEIY